MDFPPLCLFSFSPPSLLPHPSDRSSQPTPCSSGREEFRGEKVSQKFGSGEGREDGEGKGEREEEKEEGGERGSELKKKKEKKKGKKKRERKDEVQSTTQLVSACPGGWEAGLSAHAACGRRSGRSFLDLGQLGAPVKSGGRGRGRTRREGADHPRSHRPSFGRGAAASPGPGQAGAPSVRPRGCQLSSAGKRRPGCGRLK